MPRYSAGTTYFSNIQLKAHLLIGQKQTRRFYMDEASLTYDNLKDKLLSFYYGLKNESYYIYWIDEVEDKVTIGNDEDLKIMLKDTSRDNNYYNIYVAELKTEETVVDFLHTSVICDNCNKEIRGIRYKCFMCPDYDLCCKCEKEGLHNIHYMLRIVNPIQWNKTWGPRFSKSFFRHIKKAAKSESDHHHHRHGHYEKKNPTKDEDYSWVDNLIQMLNNWATIPSEESVGDENKGDDAGATKRESKTTKQYQTASNDCLFGKLNNIIDNSLQFLDPLGANIGISNIQVPTASGYSSPKKNQQNSSKDTSTSPERAQESPDKTQDTEKSPNTTTETNMNTDMPKLIPQKVYSFTTPDHKVENGEEATDVQPQQETEKVMRSGEVEGWTIVNANENGNEWKTTMKAASVTAPATTTATATAPVTTPAEIPTPALRPIYPPLNPTQAIYHADPKIEQALQTMTEMGFINEGGWLTQLLISKNGDVNKALDVLTQARQTHS